MSQYPRIYDGTNSPQSIKVTSVTARHPIGARGELEDGRVFHYASYINTVTAINPHDVVQMAAPIANHTTQAAVPVGTGAVNRADTLKTITVTPAGTAIIENEYTGGMLKMESAATGAGQTWSIGEHLAAGAGAAFSFQTHDPVLVAVTAAAAWSLVKNPWGSIIQMPAAGMTAPVGGVSHSGFAVCTAAIPMRFGWVQTWGLCSILGDNTVTVVGSGMIGTNAVAGSLGVEVAGTIEGCAAIAFEANLGVGAYQTVFLTIAP